MHQRFIYLKLLQKEVIFFTAVRPMRAYIIKVKLRIKGGCKETNTDWEGILLLLCLIILSCDGPEPCSMCPNWGEGTEKWIGLQWLCKTYMHTNTHSCTLLHTKADTPLLPPHNAKSSFIRRTQLRKGSKNSPIECSDLWKQSGNCLVCIATEITTLFLQEFQGQKERSE